MRFKLGFVVVAIWTLLFSQAVESQTVPGDVTFDVPLNLTRLWGEITKVAVWCKISSDALVGTRNKQLQAQLELPVAAGQLVTTARVVPVTRVPAVLREMGVELPQQKPAARR